MPFKEIVQKVSNLKVKQIPISDFLHLFKIFRSNFVKYGVVLENNNAAFITPEMLQNYDLGKVLSDMTSHGKMKVNFPLELYSSDHIIQAINENNWNFVFYSLPFNLMINSVRNPFISHDLRMFNLETTYYFILHYFYQFSNSLSPPGTRITVIRMLNTIVGITVALSKYDFIKTGHIGTHPLENYFGSLQIACQYDHSYDTIFRVVGKAIHVRILLDELNQKNTIRTRIGIGGTNAQIECNSGIIPDMAPFQLFKMIWHKMKLNDSDISLFESWFPCYKTIDWKEQISKSSSLSGSNIISR